MELNNDFKVGVSVPEAWKVLTDVERIAPMLPGAQLQEVEGDEYRGVVKVKVGPITAQYKGKATFVERDDSARRAVLRAEGRDTRGQGNANATITATLTPDGAGTAVRVVTDLAITGKVAQFGRGVLADVSAKLLTQFVEALEADVLSGAPAPVAAGEPEPAPAPAPPPARPAARARTAARARARPAAAQATATQVEEAPSTPSSNGAGAEPTVRKIESAPVAPVNLLDAAGGSVAKRVAPIVGSVLFLLWVFRRRRRRRSRG